MAEEVAAPSTVEFFGETLALNPDVSEFALLEFAEAASDGQDADSMRGMASLLRFVTEVVAEQDRDRFRSIARKNRASSADLVKMLIGPAEDAAERPTVRSSDSSDGPSSIAPKSVPSSVDKVSEMFPGRPDMAVAVKRSRQSA